MVNQMTNINTDNKIMSNDTVKKLALFIYNTDKFIYDLIEFLKKDFDVIYINDLVHELVDEERIYVKRNNKYVYYKNRNDLLFNLAKIYPCEIFIIKSPYKTYAERYNETPKLIVCKNTKEYKKFGSLFISDKADFKLIRAYAMANIKPETYFAGMVRAIINKIYK